MKIEEVSGFPSSCLVFRVFKKENEKRFISALWGLWAKGGAVGNGFIVTHGKPPSAP